MVAIYKVADIVTYGKQLGIITEVRPSFKEGQDICLITADGSFHECDSSALEHALVAINLDDNWNFTLFQLFGRYIAGLHNTYSQRFDSLELDVQALKQRDINEQ